MFFLADSTNTDKALYEDLQKYLELSFYLDSLKKHH